MSAYPELRCWIDLSANCSRLLGWITILCDFTEQIGLVTKEQAPRESEY